MKEKKKEKCIVRFEKHGVKNKLNEIAKCFLKI
jgi:hypothetical protein